MLMTKAVSRAELGGAIVGKAFILWLLGVPFTLLALLWVFGVFR